MHPTPLNFNALGLTAGQLASFYSATSYHYLCDFSSTMVVVAVAGGTGPGLGRNITLALAKNPNHKVIVLSREASKTPEWVQEHGIELRKVDYTSDSSVKTALQGVHTVSLRGEAEKLKVVINAQLRRQLLSTLLVHDLEAWRDYQLRLLRVGLEAGISRFAPADWGLGRLSSLPIEFLAFQPAIWDACEAAMAERKGKFEYSSFHLGLFMNYLGLGSPHPHALAGLMDDYKFIFDVENMKAQLPLNEKGEPVRLILTDLRDVGSFVNLACELPAGQWPVDLGMAGDNKRVDEIVAIIEKVRGRKMHVTYRSYEQIKADKEKEKNIVQKFWYELEDAYARDRDGEGYFPTELNHLFEDKVKPLTVEDYLVKYWKDI
jgi:hypothetical protein